MKFSKQIIRCCALIASSTLLAGIAAAQRDISVIVNGDPVMFRDIGPITVNGRVLVPVRGVLEKIGAYVDWQPAGDMVTASRGDIDMELRIGERSARVNGRTVILDVPAQIYRGRTFVPLRFMGEALGAEVVYDSAQYAVIINTAITDGGRPDPAPNPNPVPRPREIVISSFDVSETGWLQPGAVVRFTLRGTPGGEATVHIPGVLRELDMDEVRSGVYEARWTVPDDRDRPINASRVNAIARLRFGTEERVIQAREEFSVDVRDPEIKSLTPDPDSRISARRPLISAVFDDEAGSGVDTRSVRFYLDDREISGPATVTDNFVSYRPDRDLAIGLHEVRIEARDLAGNRASRTWTFRIDDRGDDVIRSFDVTGARDARPGDVLRFTLNAEAGGRATFSIGSAVLNRPMTEREPGRYEGTYTVRSGDNFDSMRISARFVTRRGEVYTIQATEDLDPTTSPVDVPRIATPREGGNVDDPMVVEGTAPRNSRVVVRVDYTTNVAGALRLTGNITEVVVTSDENGRFRTQPISLDTLVRGSDTRYTITATTLGNNGRRSEPTSINVRR